MNRSNIMPSTSTSTYAMIGSNGGWQYQVGFADQPFNVIQRINHSTLIQEMERLIDTSENIITIGVYKCPLNDWQRVQLLDCHQFVVLETASWWYSIEKNDTFIYIQRAKNIKFVLCYIGNEPRKTDIKNISYDNGRGSMVDLITFLYNNGELNKTYDSVRSNCHEFAKTIFNNFNASGKSHNILFGCSPTVKIIPPWQN